MSDENIGRVLAGKYDLVRLLGKGGMGAVYETRNAIGKRLAIKLLLKPEFAQSDERTTRFLREAKASAAIESRHVVDVYETGVDADTGWPFIVMAYLSGEDLEQVLRRVGALNPLAAVRVISQAGAGLAKAHEAGITHRDIKPANLFLASDEGECVVKVLDFGIAKLESERKAPAAAEVQALTNTGAMLGTPFYMSPEQAHGLKTTDHRTDVWSLGMCLYQALAGRLPFDDIDTLGRLIVAIVSHELPPLLALAPWVRPELAAVVHQALERDVDKRTASARHLLQALAPFTGGSNTVTPSLLVGVRGSLEATVSPDANTVSATDGPHPSLPMPRTTAGVSSEQPPLPAPKPPPHRRASWALGTTAILIAAGFWAATRSHTSTPPLSSADTPPAAISARPNGRDAAQVGVAITDHPPPKTSSAEAAAGYASALQDLRDGSMAVLGTALRHVVKLDPAFAAAHLRLAIYSEDRSEYVAASGLRRGLDARDQALLSYAEAVTAEPPDFEARLRLIRQAVAHYPEDAEIAYLLGRTLRSSGQPAEARVALDHALELDPHFAVTIWAELGIDYEDGNLDAAMADANRCLALSSMAASCLRARAGIHELRGQCAELEADTRRMVTIEPKGERSHEWFGRALAARGAPIESVRESLDKMVTMTERLGGAPSQLTESLWLALLVGDLLDAETAAQAMDRALADETGERRHSASALVLMSLAEERGEPAKALRIVEDFAKRASAWTPDDPGGARLKRLYLLRRAGLLRDAEFHEQKDRLYEEAVRRLPPNPSRVIADGTWFWFNGQYAETASEAAEAITAITAHGRPTLLGLSSWGLGKVYLLGGQASEAVAPLETAAGTCSVIPNSDFPNDGTVAFLRAHLLLGQALESKADKAGACKAYGVILERWKGAKPRSVTLEKARERAKALGCAG